MMPHLGGFSAQEFVVKLRWWYYSGMEKTLWCGDERMCDTAALAHWHTWEDALVR